MPTSLLPLKLPPGMARNNTAYTNAGRWIDGNLVRWYEGTMRPVGGWRQLLPNSAGVITRSVNGMPRAAHAWASFDTMTGTRFWMAIATTETVIAFSRSGQYGTALTNVGGAVDTTTAGGSGGADTQETPAMTWQLDNFGNILLAMNTKDGRLYQWDAALYTTSGSLVANAPINAVGVVVTDERFVVVLGAAGNLRRVAWASQETLTTWTPAATNSAGFLDVSTGGVLVCGRRVRRQTLLWTTTDLHAMSYIGGTFVYAMERAGSNCGIIAPNAVVIASDTAYWMGPNGFFAYDGYVKPIPCSVSDAVFGRLNTTQRVKVCAVAYPEFGEVWWFYPSTDAGANNENDSYVVFNYVENHWTTGKLRRTAGVGAGVFPYPVLTDAYGRVLEHDRGYDRLEVAPDGTGYRPIPFALSGPVELGTGDQFMSVTQLVPDERLLGQVTMELRVQNHPTDAETTTGLLPVRAPTDCRITGRSVRLRVQELVNSDWRVGTVRLRVTPRGRR